MNIKVAKTKSLLMVLALLLSFSTLGMLGLIAPVKAQSSPFPLLKVETPSATSYEVWLTSEGDPPAGVDEYWDIQGVDVYLRFNKAALNAIGLSLNKVRWHDFWPSPYTLLPVTTLAAEMNNDKGYVRAAFVGLPDAGGAHTPPNGKILLFSVTFSIVGSSLPPEVKLKNPDPRPIVAPWGQESFPVGVSGFAHPERSEPPWNNAPWSVPIPHFVTNPIARFSVSSHSTKPYEVVDFDASTSHHPSFIVSYEWDLDGDGSFEATGVTARTNYNQPGVYKATLRVSDSGGKTDTASRIIAVDLAQKAKAESTVQELWKDPINTITVTLKNWGTTTAEVKLEAKTYNRRTGIRAGPTLETIATVPALDNPETTEVTVDFEPPPEYAIYDMTLIVSVFDDYLETWEQTDLFKIVLKAVP